MQNSSSNSSILLYDGVCNFCNQSVQFVLNHEKNTAIQFASLQSKIGQSLLKASQLPEDYTDSLVFLESGQVYTQSSAALHISKYLKFPYSLGIVLLIVPKVIRDYIYRIVAKNRYKWFGKNDSCMLPTTSQRSRFLDTSSN